MPKEEENQTYRHLILETFDSEAPIRFTNGLEPGQGSCLCQTRAERGGAGSTRTVQVLGRLLSLIPYLAMLSAKMLRLQNTLLSINVDADVKL